MYSTRILFHQQEIRRIIWQIDTKKAIDRLVNNNIMLFACAAELSSIPWCVRE